MRSHLAALVPTILIMTIASATCRAGWPRLYEEQKATSPDGRLSFEALQVVDPVTKKPRDRFEYVVRNVRTGEVVWRQLQDEEAEEPAVKITVTDDARAVVETGDYQILLFGPDGGRLAALRLTGFNKSEEPDLFTQEERKKYLVALHSGVSWGDVCRYTFHEGARTYFVYRPYWGRRIVVDLSSGKSIEPAADVLVLMLRAERAWVLGELAVVRRDDRQADADGRRVSPAGEPAGRLLLRDRVPDLQRDVREDADRRRLLTAIDLAGRLKVREAIPDLERAVADWREDQSREFPVPLPWSKIPTTYWELDRVRLAAQTALRRMGVRPKRLPNLVITQFKPKLRWIFPEKNEPPATPPNVALEQIRAGMSVADVLTQLGTPNYLDGSVRKLRFRYDLDEPQPMSLVITFEQDRVGKVVRHSPPLWEGELRRTGEWPHHGAYQELDPSNQLPP